MLVFNRTNKKHILIKNRLELDGKRLAKKGLNLTVVAKKVGDILYISKITVLNYINGEIKDGYLAEAILAELKKIK